MRGKGSNKTKTIFGEDEDEETHVLITGPGEEAVQIARKLVETLIDFNSAEGESMRQEQRKKGQILNGTYREDKDVELRHLLFSGDKAKVRVRDPNANPDPNPDPNPNPNPNP